MTPPIMTTAYASAWMIAPIVKITSKRLNVKVIKFKDNDCNALSDKFSFKGLRKE